MKTLDQLRPFLLTAILLIFLCSCGGNRYANTGTSSDRTGTNGATNGNGKVPQGTERKVNY